MSHQLTRVVMMLLASGLAACRPGTAALADSARADSLARVRQDSINRAQPGYVIDSILPIEEELRRFRADLATAPAAFSGGADSREALIRGFVRALEAADTTALIRLAVSRAEFAYLVYPESPYTAPPYRQAPGLVWMRLAGASGNGLTRLLGRMAGSRLGNTTGQCVDPPVREGQNSIWRDCTLRIVRAPGDTLTTQLFGAIIERGGRFKILSYANDL